MKFKELAQSQMFDFNDGNRCCRISARRYRDFSKNRICRVQSINIEVFNVGLTPLKTPYFLTKPKTTKVRKTQDCRRFYVNYGQGWEHEITEYSRDAMKENRKAYQENCPYPLKITLGREPIEVSSV